MKKQMIITKIVNCPLVHFLAADRPHPNAAPATKNRQYLNMLKLPPSILHCSDAVYYHDRFWPKADFIPA